MAFDHNDYVHGISRRHTIERLLCTAAAAFLLLAGGLSASPSQVGSAQAATPGAQAKPTIPIIVKDKTSPYWQAVLAGARKAGQDLGVNVVELGADSEADANGQ